MSTQFNEYLLMAEVPNRICGFKRDENIYFYNRSLFRWVSLGGGIRGEIKTEVFKKQVIYSGFLPEGVLISKLHSGKYGRWGVSSWGYEIMVDVEDDPLWM